MNQLRMTKPKIFTASFDRPNLRYSVVSSSGRTATLKQIIETVKSKFVGKCGIIYCISKADCDYYANIMISEGIKAKSYHAGLSDKVRKEVQSEWSTNKIDIVCATISFGMGIDKADVSFVIHSALPKSLEGYYQESGRAGSDGNVADCVLFYHYGDVSLHRKMMDNGLRQNSQRNLNNLYEVVSYCENFVDCRRKIQLDYFGEYYEVDNCLGNKQTACDNCRNKDKYELVDVTIHAANIMRLIVDLTSHGRRTTALRVVDVYKGCKLKEILNAGEDKLAFHGAGKLWSKDDIQRILHKLIMDGYLTEYIQNNAAAKSLYIRPCRDADKLLDCIDVEIKLGVDRSYLSRDDELTPKDKVQRDCYQELVAFVDSVAGALDKHHSTIIRTVDLRAISMMKPMNEGELLKILTPIKVKSYGKVLMEITKKYAKQAKDISINDKAKATKRRILTEETVAEIKKYQRSAKVQKIMDSIELE